MFPTSLPEATVHRCYLLALDQMARCLVEDWLVKGEPARAASGRRPERAGAGCCAERQRIEERIIALTRRAMLTT